MVDLDSGEHGPIYHACRVCYWQSKNTRLPPHPSYPLSHSFSSSSKTRRSAILSISAPLHFTSFPFFQHFPSFSPMYIDAIHHPQALSHSQTCHIRTFNFFSSPRISLYLFLEINFYLLLHCHIARFPLSANFFFHFSNSLNYVCD